MGNGMRIRTLALLIWFVGSAEAGTLRIETNTPNVNSLLATAVPGDTVMIARGVHSLIETMSVPDGLTVMGETGNPANVVLIGNGSEPVIELVNGRTARLAGLSIRGGDIGISIGWYETVEIDDCIISGCTGRGVYIGLSDVTMNNCEIRDNGGGIYIYGYTEMKSFDSLTVNDTSITGNVADYGGGIRMEDAHVQLTRCTITGNNASGLGGGVFTSMWGTLPQGGSFEAEDCIIRDNTAFSGPDGYSLAYPIHLNCCDVEQSMWVGGTAIIITEEDCGVANESMSWGDLKSLWR